MVRERFITEATFDNIGELAVLGWWYASETVIPDVRKRIDLDLFVHLEWLKERLRKEAFVPDQDRVNDFLRRDADLSILEPEGQLIQPDPEPDALEPRPPA